MLISNLGPLRSTSLNRVTCSLLVSCRQPRFLAVNDCVWRWLQTLDDLPRFLLSWASMAARRNRTISTKVTDVEYHAILRLAEPLTVSEWARKVLVRAAHPDLLHFLLLAEFMALRNIVINLDCSIASKIPVTVDMVHEIVDRADGDKFNRARERHATLRPAIDPARR